MKQNLIASTLVGEVAFILMALASVTADAQTNNAAPPTGDNAATNEIRGWLDRWTKAFTEEDVDAIMALYADDVIAYDIVPPLQYVGKSAYRGDYQQFMSHYDNLHVEVRDLHVGATGDLGYAAGLELISGTLTNGQKWNVWLRFTSLFESRAVAGSTFTITSRSQLILDRARRCWSCSRSAGRQRNRSPLFENRSFEWRPSEIELVK